MSTYNGNPVLGPPAVRPRRGPAAALVVSTVAPRCGGTAVGNPQLADPFDQPHDRAKTREVGPISEILARAFGVAYRSASALAPWRPTEPEDAPRDTARRRVWRPSLAGFAAPVDFLAELAVRTADPWSIWRTCTEMDPPGLYGRQVPKHLTDDQRSGGDYDR